MKKYKWWIYTVLIGLLPFIARWFIYFVINKVEGEYVLNEIDMVAFGLVMATSNINELEGNQQFDSDWRSFCIGVSLVLVMFMTVILGVAYLMDVNAVNQLDRMKLKFCSLALSTASFLFSINIIYKPRYLSSRE